MLQRNVVTVHRNNIFCSFIPLRSFRWANDIHTTHVYKQQSTSELRQSCGNADSINTILSNHSDEIQTHTRTALQSFVYNLHQGKVTKIPNNNITFTMQAAGFPIGYVNITVKLGSVFASWMTERVECVSVQEWRMRIIHHPWLAERIASVLILTNMAHAHAHAFRETAANGLQGMQIKQLAAQTKCYVREAFKHQRLSRGEKHSCLNNKITFTSLVCGSSNSVVGTCTI